MATLTQLRKQIEIDAGVIADAKFPRVRLLRIINLAQRFVQTQLGGLGFQKWVVTQTVTAGLTAAKFSSGTNNVKKIAIDATYFPNLLEFPKSIKFIEVNDGTNYGEAFEVDEDEFGYSLRNVFLQPSVKDAKFMRLAGSVWLAPVGITVATAYYYKAITDLSADADTTAIPLEFEDQLIKRAVAEIDGINGKLADKQNLLNEISKEIADAYRSTLIRVSEESKTGKEKVELQ